MTINTEELTVDEKRSRIDDLRAQRETINSEIEQRRLQAGDLSQQIRELEDSLPKPALGGRVTRLPIGRQ